MPQAPHKYLMDMFCSVPRDFLQPSVFALSLPRRSGELLGRIPPKDHEGNLLLQSRGQELLVWEV